MSTDLDDPGGRAAGGRRPASDRRTGSRTAWTIASGFVALRWLIVAGWLVTAAAAVTALPVLTASGGGLGDLTSADNPALVAEQRSARDFGFPLLSRLVLVQSDPAGLPESVARTGAERAAAVTRAGDGPVLAAFPVPGDSRVPGVRQAGTTIVTYLYPRPDQGFADAVRSAREYAARFAPSEHVVGITGSVPARVEQERLIGANLPLLEAVSAAAVLLIVGIAFRSLVAPLLTLGTAGLSFALVTRVGGLLADRLGLSIPPDLEPLMVALMLGVTTDYVVYMLSGMRTELALGHERRLAARRACATFLPILVVAGVTICAGVGTLLLARSPAIRAFGPAMALSVLVALVVAVTLLPAALAILGRVAFWPSRPGAGPDVGGGGLRRGSVRLLRTRVGATLVVTGCVAGLVLLAAPVRELRFGLPFIAALPDGSEPARAARAAAAGFVPGVTAPTLVEVRPGTAGAPVGAYQQLQERLSRLPHVAAVLGPREDDAARRAAGRDVGAFVTSDGMVARYLVVLDVDPLDAVAIDAVRDLGRRLPGLAAQAGLPTSTTAGVGGDTAALVAIVDASGADLTRILVAALAVNLLLLAVFLRALVAPLLLVGCTALSAAATLGVTVLLFQDRLGHPGITFFVPLATVVLLLALGSDYNLFAVGHVWEEARHRSLKDAMLAALPTSSAAISTAGVALAASLGALALVPLRQSRELAFTLALGILLDALVVRTVLVPALLGLFGRLSGWPGRRLADDQPRRDAADTG